MIFLTYYGSILIMIYNQHYSWFEKQCNVENCNVRLFRFKTLRSKTSTNLPYIATLRSQLVQCRPYNVQRVSTLKLLQTTLRLWILRCDEVNSLTHWACGWSLAKPLDRTFLETPYQYFMWYSTKFVLNTEDENWTQNTHIYDHFS